MAYLKDFTHDCTSMDLKSFTAAHGNAFLIHHGPIGMLKEPLKEKKTLAVEGGPADTGFDPREDFLVFQLRKRSESKDRDDLIRVGRMEDNDVVIPDASISALHASFLEGAGGEYTLVDNGSMNGTFVNMRGVPVQGRGVPKVVKSLSRLRFGSVVMTFLVAPDFYKLVREFF